ncbi:MAG: polyketide synthase dehydratase domain-containing protein [Candidatus Koribacter versatilis]|uniref:Polyketide synthase dehydratase domain-containing protein n=1 Tax=Candidatus Korobacter versatilis TaxID=658062 RepID=A0A932A5U2_9BACT|nr:polyketide synthase dehydratase domain-containing protein [Candidatus Koribacter versatilis]
MPETVSDTPDKPRRGAEPIAIVGMECVFPGARNLEAFWRNIVQGVDAIRDVPASRFDPQEYGLGQIRGGFLDGLAEFDPVPLGIMPNAVNEGDPEQFLVLGVIHGALRNAESARKSKPPAEQTGARTEVVIGRGGYLGNSVEHMYLRTEVVAQVAAILERMLPEATPEVRAQLRERLTNALPPVTAEVVAGSIPNLACGRAANRLDLMGAGFTVDAACASSLIAVDSIVHSLREGRCDVGVAAGAHLIQKPYFWAAFETLGALSHSGKIAPFSHDADGLVVGEGVGAVVLKRLSDAERDGDRIYAVIRGVGVSSDGRGAAVLSPRVEGEVLAIARAYEESGVEPGSVSLIEGHGTATSVGDAAEIGALDQAFGKNSFADIALGSVKSMIGHAMPAAGMAGLIKTALALHHRILPPTLNVGQAHPALSGTRFYVNATTRPWISPQGTSRRAGVNAFGFGGINAHVVLEQAPLGPTALGQTPHGAIDQLTPQSSELFLFSAARVEELIAGLRHWRAALAPLAEHELRDVAYSVSRHFRHEDECRLGLVAENLGELAEKLTRAARRLETDRHPTSFEKTWVENDGIYFSREPRPGKLAFLFPGIGFPGMAGGYTDRLAELCLHFPEVQATVDAADRFTLEDGTPYPLRHQFFPPPLLASAEFSQIERELAWSSRAPAGMLMANIATLELMKRVNVAPDAVAGFSLGEWAALVAGGVLDESAIDHFAHSKEILHYSDERGLWAVVATSAEQAETVLHRIPGIVSVTMDVSPTQVFIGGEKASVSAALVELQKLGIWGHELPVLPFHTPLAAEFAEKLKKMMAEMPVKSPTIPVYCGMNGRPYPSEPAKIRELVAENTCEPVHVRETVSQLYRDGVRIFVQLGGGGKFLPNIQNTLALEPHVALSVDLEHRGGLEQFHHVLARLATLGVPLDACGLYRNRVCREIDPLAPAPRPSKTMRALPLAPPRLRPSDDTIAWLRAQVKPQPAHAPAIPLPALPAVSNIPTAGVSRPPVGAVAPKAGRKRSAVASALAAEAVATLEQFLALQQREEETELAVFQQFLATQEAAMLALATPAAPAIDDVPATGYPLLGEIREHVPGEHFESQLVLGLEGNPFLRDHALLRVPQELKPTADCLPTIPFTFEAEILAEAAALLAPELRLDTLHDMEATRWISIEDGAALELQVRARRTGHEVSVELTPAGQGRPVFRGKATLASDTMPAPPPLEVPPLDRTQHTAQEFYQRGPLFHRELYQVIANFHGETGGAISADLRVTDPAAMSDRAGSMLLEPVLLDAAGQLLAYCALQEGWAVFPQRLGKLRCFGERPAAGSLVRANMRFRKLDARRLHADVDLLRPDGALWMRMEAWQPWRVLWPKDLLRYRDDRCDGFIAERVATAEGMVFRARRADLGDMNPEWVARLYLRGDEWKTYRKRPRLDWLLGRVAAKDAIRTLVREKTGKLLHPLELETGNLESGAPVVTSEGHPSVSVSIAHVEDEAIAVAVASDMRAGIDVARIGEKQLGFRELAFDSGELALLARHGGGIAAMHRAWSAKEAALKAFGRGLDSMPSYRCDGLLEDGGVEIGYENERLRVSTWTEGDLVFALLLRRR